jgi:nucleotide-binding universal stress UspA family protein
LPSALPAREVPVDDGGVTATAEALVGLPFAHDPGRTPRLLLATDGSPESVAARGAAVDLARRVHAELEIVHVWLAPPAEEIAVQREARRVLFREQLDAVNEGACVHATHLVEGDPASVIIEIAASSHTDLVVMGGRRLEGFDRWLLGSVSDPVARVAQASVLVVRAPAKLWPPQRVAVGPHLDAEARQVAADVAHLLEARLCEAGHGMGDAPADPAPERTLTVLARGHGNHLVVDVRIARRLRAAAGPVLVVAQEPHPRPHHVHRSDRWFLPVL